MIYLACILFSQSDGRVSDICILHNGFVLFARSDGLDKEKRLLHHIACGVEGVFYMKNNCIIKDQ